MEAAAQVRERDVVVLFTDICGYTAFVSTEGSVAAVKLRELHDNLVLPLVSKWCGKFVKNTGDGVIAYFDSAGDAVECAVATQETFAQFNKQGSEVGEIHIRIGIQAGKAVITADDILGQAVNFAARIVGVCKADQVLIGNDARRSLRQRRRFRLARVGTASLDGIPTPQDIYEVAGTKGDLQERKKSQLLPVRPRSDSRFWVLVALFALAALVFAVFHYKQSRNKADGNPSESQRLYDLATGYERKGDDEQALAALNRATEIDKRFAAAFLRAALISYQLSQDDQARKYLASASSLAQSMGDKFTLKTEALKLQLDGFNDEALKRYQLLVDRYSDDVEAHFLFGDLALESGNQDVAAAQLASCVQSDPTNPFCNFDLLMLKVKRGDYTGVDRDYQSLVRRGVTYPWFNIPLGAAFLCQERFEDASRAFHALQDTSRRMPGSAHFRAAKDWDAGIAVYRGRFKDADSLLRLAAETSASTDERAGYALYRSQIANVFGRRAIARAAAEEAARTTSAPMTVIGAAQVLAANGEPEKARILIDQHFAAKPVAEGVGVANQHAIFGVAAFARGDFRAAISEMSKSYDIDDSLETTYLLARSYESAGRWRDALPLYGRIISEKGSVVRPR
jgi:class 3 adenylate cyclase